MSATANTACMTCGQGGFDTAQVGTLNGGAGFEIASPLGGMMPYQAATANYAAMSAQRQAMPVYASFTASNMQVRLTGTGGGSTPSVPVNYYFKYGTSNTTLVQGAINVAMPYGASWPGSPAGVVKFDSLNHDYIPAGDVACMCVQAAAGTGSLCAATVSWQADFVSGIGYPLTSDLSSNNAAHVPANITAAARRWVAAAGQFWESNTTAPAQVQQLMPTSGTWKFLSVLVDSFGGTDSDWRQFQSFHGTAFLSPDPGAGGMPYGNQLIPRFTATAGTSLINYDSLNHDYVPAGDLIGIEYQGQTNADQNTYYMGSTSLFVPDNPNTTPMLSGGNPSAGLNTSQSLNQLAGGSMAWRPASTNPTAESLALVPMSGTFSGLNMVCGAVDGTTSATAQFYYNTSVPGTAPPTNQFVNHIGADANGNPSTTQIGVRQDTLNHDYVPAGDAFAFSETGMGSTFKLNSFSVAFETVGPAPSGGGGLLLRGVG